MPKNEKSIIQNVSRMTLSQIKKAYSDLAEEYTKIVEGAYCARCGTFKKKAAFYVDIHNASGTSCICKECAYKIALQIENNRDEPNPTQESITTALRLLNKPYISSLYHSSFTELDNELLSKNKTSIWTSYIKNINSLKQYFGMQYSDSVFDIDEEEADVTLSKKAKEEAIRRFGDGYTDSDYKFLYDEFKDWCARYECNTKGMEIVFQRIVSTELEIRNAKKNGKATKDLDKTLQDLMDSGNIKPKQTAMDGIADAQTLGTLIQKWEETKPLPDIDPELEDVDNIGKYITTFFLGHACKMLDIKNKFSHIYESNMEKYTVKKPEYDDDIDSEVLFDKIFGNSETD